MKSLKDLLKDNNFETKNYSHKKPTADVFDFIDLVNGWGNIVGDRLKESTIPLKLMNKSLTVLTSHPVFAQQLSFMEKIIIQKIEKNFPQMFGQIFKIYFKADNAFFNKQVKETTRKEVSRQEFKQKWHKHSPEYKALEEQALALVGEVSDPELKEHLVSLFIQLKN